jgi:hypothetical protein
MNLGGGALCSGGCAIAAPVFSAGPAVTLVCIRASVVARRRGYPSADSRPSGAVALARRVTALLLAARKCLLNQAKVGFLEGVRNRGTRPMPALNQCNCSG